MSGPLPDRALLIAPTVERAAALGVAFDDAVSATPEDLASVLELDGATLACAAVTGVPARGGRLAGVLQQVLAACPPEVEILLDVGDRTGWALLSDGAAALRGLEPVGLVDTEGALCLRLRRAPDPDAVPDLEPVRDKVPPPFGTAERLALAADALLGPAQATELRSAVERLQAQLTTATRALAASEDKLAEARKDQRATAQKLERVTASPLGRAAALADAAARRGPSALAGPKARRLAMLAGAGAVGVLAVAGVTARGGGREGALLAALLVSGPAPVLYARRGNRRLAASIERVAKAVETARGPGSGSGSGSDEQARDNLAATLARLAEQVGEVQHTLAVVAASTVDTAHGLARLAAPVPERARPGPA